MESDLRLSDIPAPVEDDWDRVSDIFAASLDAGANWETVLKDLCNGSEWLERNVSDLLENHVRAGSFLQNSIMTTRLTASKEIATAYVFSNGDLIARRFLIGRLLGAGGMGEVYEAFDSKLSERVALKTLRSAFSDDPLMADHFRAEVLRSRQITHPNVARVHDLFSEMRDDGTETPFFTMKLLEGETLAQYLSRGGGFKVDEALQLLHQIAEALHAAHKVGIIHRDFKPGNIFLSPGPDGSNIAIVTDFGLAVEFGTAVDEDDGLILRSSASLFAGTPAYMAPEQISGGTTSPATDVYALGLVAYEMVSGKQLFSNQSTLICALKKFVTVHPNVLVSEPKFPAAWLSPVLRCLEFDPTNRFQSPIDFINELTSKQELTRSRQPTFTNLAFSKIGLAVLLSIILIASIATVVWSHFDWNRADLNPSIAVLPFQNVSRDPGMLYLSDGIAEDLTNGFTSYSQLKVIARTSAFRYRDSSAELKRVSKALGVRMILLGSIVQRGQKLHITVELVQAESDRQVWSHAYDRDANELIGVEAEIIRDVISRLDFPSSVKPKRDYMATRNADAYDLYLRGRYLWNTRTHEGVLKGLDYFNKAVSLDQGFALAYTAIADTFNILIEYGWAPPLEAEPKIREALDHSLKLDPESAETYSSLGFFEALVEWNHVSAEKAFRRALSLNPALVSAHLWYGNFLMRSGRLDDALREAQTARQLDPASLTNITFESWVRYYRREYELAIKTAKQAIELNPSFPHSYQVEAQSFASLGRVADALDASAMAVRLTSDQAVALRYRALVLSVLPGHSSEAKEVASKLEKLSENRQAGYLVIVYAGLHDDERMFFWVSRALATKDNALLLANIAPSTDRYRSDSRFRTVLRQIGY